MRTIKGLLFDLDGTLLDSAPDLTAALNQVRAEYDLPALPVADVRAGVSRGATGMLGLGFPAVSKTEYQHIRKKFLTYYAHSSVELSEPFPGVVELLDCLDIQRIPWAIVTNKSEQLTLPIVTALGWHVRAKMVVCGDTTDQPKPSSKPILLACEALSLKPEKVVMIGDDLRDIQAGQAAGCYTAGVGWGYADHQTDWWLQADFQYHSVVDMYQLIQ